MSDQLSYALVTPARNEEQNLLRLADSLAAQTLRPRNWVIVDNASTDRTGAIAAQLADANDWIKVIEAPGEPSPVRGGPVVRAFVAGLALVDEDVEVIVKLDADVSMRPDHFEGLVREFATDTTLGIAGGLCLEEYDGEWRPQYTTRSHVRGAVRAYRRECLEDVMPLEQRMGWDGIDEIKATTHAWRTTSFQHLPFLHHRSLAAREQAVSAWRAQGDMAHYMGYRPSYLVARALYRAAREPRALAIIWGYAEAVLARKPRCSDPAVLDWLRAEQRLRRLPLRAREALGRIPHRPDIRSS